MFNNIILKISILSFMTGIRHTDVKGISSGNPGCPPPVTCGDSPVGACGSASLRRHLRCFGSLAGNLADAPVRPCWAIPEIPSVHPQSPAVTAPSGHAAPLRSAGTCAASVPLQETSLTLRCGPEGPSHLCCVPDRTYPEKTRTRATGTGIRNNL